MPRTKAFYNSVVLVSQLDLQRTVFGTQTLRGCRKQPREWQGKRHVKRAVRPISCLKLDQNEPGYATHGTCTFQIKSLIQQERPRPQEQNDERPVSHHSIKAHLHSWSIAKTLLQCPHSLFSTAILPHSISPVPQAHDLLLGQSSLLSLNSGWEWQTDVHKHASTVFQKKSVMFCIWKHWMLIYHGWKLNGVFGCIILNCIIRNYGPYAISGSCEDIPTTKRNLDGLELWWASAEMHIHSASQMRSLTDNLTAIYRCICILPGYFKLRSSATNTNLLSSAKRSLRQSSVQKRD